jgi:hypothetical protein
MVSSSYLLYSLTYACLVWQSFAGLAVREQTFPPQLNYTVASNATVTDIDNARIIIKNAIANMTVLNKARLAHPRRNQYHLKPQATIMSSSPEAPPPLLNITSEIANAAALLAEVDNGAKANVTNSARVSAGTFWMEGLARKGTVPWGNDASYKACISPNCRIAVYYSSLLTLVVRKGL